jgi:hypothetical protein
MPSAHLRVDPQLWFLLRRDRRRPLFEVEVSATDTVGHVVQMVGVPFTEVGTVRLDGRSAERSTRVSSSGGHGAGDGATIDVAPRLHPQATRSNPPWFVLDVHLGSLARRLRLIGLDTAYESDADDDHLVDVAVRERRVLLSRDRGLLGRRALPEGALVRGRTTDEQLEDVLGRFAPPLAPWTRCVRCNGQLRTVPAEEVAGDLEPGTRRSYRHFSRCLDCGRVYWRGAHSRSLEMVVRRAEVRAIGARRSLAQ